MTAPRFAALLADELDAHLPRMAFHQYGQFYNDDPDFDIEAYYLRVAEAIVPGLEAAGVLGPDHDCFWNGRMRPSDGKPTDLDSLRLDLAPEEAAAFEAAIAENLCEPGPMLSALIERAEATREMPSLAAWEALAHDAIRAARDADASRERIAALEAVAEAAKIATHAEHCTRPIFEGDADSCSVCLALHVRDCASDQPRKRHNPRPPGAAVYCGNETTTALSDLRIALDEVWPAGFMTGDLAAPEMVR